jgi:glycerol-3-phosphate dehydrogenase (NAD(P)+)
MSGKNYKDVLVIGAGAFGTSIASVAAHRFQRVFLKVRSQDIYDFLLKKENNIYLPGVKLPDNIIPILEWDDLETNKAKIDLVVSGLPTKAMFHFFEEHKQVIEDLLNPGIPFVSLAKGIDTETLLLPDDILLSQFPKYADQLAFLSGPSFANEIVERQITLVSVAGRSRKMLVMIADMLQTPYFKVFPTYDIKGVLLGGALKNILAIAGGILEGMGYNHNTRAAMITRGIEEMLRFGRVFNARPETFYGLSGMGDLILTTTGELSRNKKFGMEVAKGRTPEDIISSTRSVVEGYKTTLSAYKMAEKYEIRTRIFDAMYRILYQNADIAKIIDHLMKLPVKFDSY